MKNIRMRINSNGIVDYRKLTYCRITPLKLVGEVRSQTPDNDLQDDAS